MEILKMDNGLNEEVMKSFKTIGGVKYIREIIDDLDVDKKIKLKYYKILPVQFQAKPSIFDENKGKVKGSNFSLKTIYNLTYSYMNNRGIDLEPTPENLKMVLKAIVSHEVGHLLDEDLIGNMLEYAESVVDTVDDMKRAGINVSNVLKVENRMIVDEEIKEKMNGIRRILIERETTAWYIARNILKFENEQEEKVFKLVKECALATYNAVGIKEVVLQYHLLTAYRIMNKKTV